MALIKMSSVGITNISGKAGGSIYSRNRGGAYVKNFAVPSNPQSAAQLAVRSLFGSLASSWRGLGSDAQKGWNQAAISFPVKDAFGDDHVLSGNSLYQMLNSNLSTINEPRLTNPPVKQGVSSVASVALVATQLPTGATLVLNVTATLNLVADVETMYSIRATPPLSAGVYSASNKMRSTQNVTQSAITGGIDISTRYSNNFGQPPIGAAIIVEVVPINRVTGERGASFKQRVVVADASA